MDYPVAVNKFFPLKLEFVDINHRLLFDLKCLIQPLKMNHSAKGFEGFLMVSAVFKMSKI